MRMRILSSCSQSASVCLCVFLCKLQKMLRAAWRERPFNAVLISDAHVPNQANETNKATVSPRYVVFALPHLTVHAECDVILFSSPHSSHWARISGILLQLSASKFSEFSYLDGLTWKCSKSIKFHSDYLYCLRKEKMIISLLSSLLPVCFCQHHFCCALLSKKFAG